MILLHYIYGRPGCWRLYLKAVKELGFPPLKWKCPGCGREL